MDAEYLYNVAGIGKTQIMQNYHFTKQEKRGQVN